MLATVLALPAVRRVLVVSLVGAALVLGACGDDFAGDFASVEAGDSRAQVQEQLGDPVVGGPTRPRWIYASEDDGQITAAYIVRFGQDGGVLGTEVVDPMDEGLPILDLYG
jgi:hypothetical protein